MRNVLRALNSRGLASLIYRTETTKNNLLESPHSRSHRPILHHVIFDRPW